MELPNKEKGKKCEASRQTANKLLHFGEIKEPASLLICLHFHHPSAAATNSNAGLQPLQMRHLYIPVFILFFFFMCRNVIAPLLPNNSTCQLSMVAMAMLPQSYFSVQTDDNSAARDQALFRNKRPPVMTCEFEKRYPIKVCLCLSDRL